MAFTVTKKDIQSVGRRKVATYEVTADGAEANLTAASTGMKYIDYFHVGVQSMATFAYTMKANLDSSGVASNGCLSVSGVASGDVFYISLYGR